MKQVLVSSLIAICGMIAANRDAQATFYTETASVDVHGRDGVGDPVTAPIGSVIQGLTGDGTLYTNTYGVDVNGNFLVRTVGAVRITTLIRNSAPVSIDGILGPGATADQVVVVFAVDGYVDPAFSSVGHFTSGAVMVFNPATPGGFSGADPSTWLDPLDNPYYVAALSVQENVEKGGGFNLTASASETQTSVASGINVLNNGLFLFTEVTDPGIGYTPTAPNAGFLDVTSTTGVPAGVTAREAIANQTNQTLNTGFTSVGFDLTMLNKVAGLAGFGDLNSTPGDQGDYFASSNVADGFATYFTVGGPTNGDFEAEVTSKFYPGLSTAPEPSSLALMAMGIGISGLYARRRTRKTKAAA